MRTHDAVRTEILHGSPEWHEARRGKINISTASSILYPGKQGVYGSPFTEYVRITDELLGKQTADKKVGNEEILEWGTITEPLHLEMLRKRMPELIISPNKSMYQHAKHSFIVGTPDALGFDQMETMIIETKAPVYHEPWEQADCPTGPMTQAMLYASMFDTTKGCIVSALIPPGIKTFKLARNKQWEEWAWAKLEDFWNNNILRGIAPQADASKGLELLEGMQRDTGASVKLPEELKESASRMEVAKSIVKEWEEVEKTCRAKIMQAMAGAEIGQFEDGSGFSYLSQTRNSPAREATTSTYRVFRAIKACKKKDTGL